MKANKLVFALSAILCAGVLSGCGEEQREPGVLSIMAYNGGEIIDCQSGKIIFRRTLPEALARFPANGETLNVLKPGLRGVTPSTILFVK